MLAAEVVMRPWFICALSVTSAACTPELTTPDGAGGGDGLSGADWEAPENAWHGVDTVPSDLEAGGWAEGQVAPDFRLVDQNGDTVSLWQFYGDVIALDLSTMWCGPCQLLAREVDEVQEDYEAEGFIYITLLPENVDGEVPSVENLNEWAERNSVSAPILSDGDGHAYDIVPDKIWPHVMVIGRDMRVVESQVLPAADASIRLAIEDAL